MKEVQYLLPGDLWDPLLNIVNVTGDFDHERRSYVVRYEEGYEAPVVLHRWRFKGLFKEVMMLRHFPFDVQVNGSVSSLRVKGSVSALQVNV